MHRIRCLRRAVNLFTVKDGLYLSTAPSDQVPEGSPCVYWGYVYSGEGTRWSAAFPGGRGKPVEGQRGGHATSYVGSALSANGGQ